MSKWVEGRRGLTLLFALGSLCLAVVQRMGTGYLRSLEIAIAFVTVFFIIPRLSFLNYRTIGRQLKVYEFTFLALYLLGGVGTFISSYVGSGPLKLILFSFLDTLAIFLSLSLAFSFYRLYHIGASKKRKFLLGLIVLIFFLNLIGTGFFAILVVLIIIHGARIKGISSSHHSLRIKLFLLLVLFWVLFFLTPKGLFISPKSPFPGSYFGSSLYSLFVKSFITYIMLFTFVLAVSLVETSRRLSTKSAISYVFQALIPMVILIAVIAGNMVFLSVSLKLFAIHRSYIGSLGEYVANLFSSPSFKEKMRNGSLNEVAQQVVAPIAHSFPGIFAVVEVERGKEVERGVSEGTPPDFFANFSIPTWVVEDRLVELVKKGNGYFIFAYYEGEEGGKRVRLALFVPLRDEFIQMVEKEYAVKFIPIKKETPSADKGSNATTIIHPDKRGLVISLDTKKGGKQRTERKEVSFLNSLILAYPLSAVDWERGERKRFAELKLYNSYTAIFSLSEGETPSFFSSYLVLIRAVNLAVLVVAFFLIIFSTYIGGRVSRGMKVSLTKLVEGMRRIGCGDLECKIKLPSRDEYYQLARSINLMTEDLKKYLDEVVENERIKQELLTASTIQLSMLPVADPKIPGYEIVSHFRPAKEVGGDYYDYFPLGDDRLAIVIGDVSGEGISAGLLMAMAKSCLLNQIRVSPDVPKVMYAMNNMVYEALRKRLLMTLCYSVLDIPSRTLTFASAGHHFPYLYSKKGGKLSELESIAYPLGVRRDSTYRAKRIELGPGDYLVFYTDGIIEARNQDGEEFGFERFERVILSHTISSAREMRDGILKELHEFSRGEPQFDDITLVIIKVKEEEDGF